MAETANDLVLKCAAMVRTGADFPTVWDAVLKRHALVAGPPVQSFDDEAGPQLEVPLINGQRLVCNSAPNEYFVLGLQAAAHFSVSQKNRHDRLRGLLLRSWTTRCFIEDRVHLP